VTTGVEHDDFFVNKGLLIGLLAFKRAQLSAANSSYTHTAMNRPVVA
jgi:hypothetical protein